VVSKEGVNKRRVTLSADDYGLAPGVSCGIRELLAAGRLTGTACMTGGPHWPDEAARLKTIHGENPFDVGVHLTLTEQPAITDMPGLAPDGRLPGLGRLIGLALTGRIDRAEVAGELTAQIDRFEAAWGAPPDFLDGHHHAHQLPIVGDVVLDLYRTRLNPGRAWIRRCTAPLGRVLGTGVAVRRALVIGALGRSFSRRLDRAGVVSNRVFAGVRDFTGEPPYATLMRNWLIGAPDGTLIMCHPGYVDDVLRAADSLTSPREEELSYLISPEFPALLDELGMTLASPLRA
jgi:predicted glycoside hydrolase/deacetylase ChbG (UPF0249 family)